MREEIEQVTDQQMAGAIGALGDDAAELFAVLEPWGVEIREKLGYLSAGPHDLTGGA